MAKRILIVFVLLIAGASAFISIKTPGGFSGFWVMLSSVTGLNTTELEGSAKDSFALPPGFQIQVFAEELPYPRFMQITDQQDILISLPDSGEIIILKDRDRDDKAESVDFLLSGLDNPQGMALHDGWLYFSERDSVSRVRFDSATGTLSGTPEPIIEDLPYGHAHWTHNAKPIGISPDGKLHINVGSPCNICEPEDPRYAAMLRADLDGNNLGIFATGLRNSVDFDWAPWSGELYATDNGSDFLGDDFPPDELNKIEQHGFYGWPYFHGDNVPHEEYSDRNPFSATDAIEPALKLPAHNAPLGIRFIQATGNLPADFEKSALVALHGSWNRSSPDGFKVISLHWNEDGTITSRDFVTNFLTPEGVVGRPVDIRQRGDGGFYISDDLGGKVYLITYSGE